MLLSDNKRKWLFEIVLAQIFGGLLAITMPDLEGLDFPFEKEFFFIEHYILLVINPLVIIIYNRYETIYSSWKDFIQKKIWGTTNLLLYMWLVVIIFI